jgi:hypothetical protein
MATLISIPLLGALMMFQSSIVSRVQLLHGTADIVLLALIAWALQQRVRTAWHWSLVGSGWFTIASALPLGVMPAAYFLTTGLALMLRRRIWQIPILGMFVGAFFGTLITQGFSIVSLLVVGTSLPLLETLNLITLPSLLLNLLIAAPVYVIVSDLANWLYPQEIET